jgi:hypothetical protein
MTMIVGLVNPRFALVMTDTKASVTGDVACVLADGTPHVLKAGDSFTTQKFWLSHDQRDIVAASGDLARHNPLAIFAVQQHGFAIDDVLSAAIFAAMNRFDTLPGLPVANTLAQEQFLHLWEQGGRFMLTRIDAHLALAHRETWRSKPAGTDPVAIGSGGPPFATALAIPATAAAWDALHARPDATPEEYRASPPDVRQRCGNGSRRRRPVPNPSPRTRRELEGDPSTPVSGSGARLGSRHITPLLRAGPPPPSSCTLARGRRSPLP